MDRVQTGVRIERRILQVLKGIGAARNLTLGDLIEGVMLHAFEGRAAFGPDSLELIAALRKVYGLDLTAEDSHRLVEAGAAPARSAATKKRR